MNTTTSHQDDFDAILVAELETLREGETRLKRLYPRLRQRPQLREFFLRELAAVQERAERLHAVLNPCDAFERAPAACSVPNVSPAA